MDLTIGSDLDLAGGLDSFVTWEDRGEARWQKAVYKNTIRAVSENPIASDYGYVYSSFLIRPNCLTAFVAGISGSLASRFSWSAALALIST
jgi:hypothetical protein